MSRRWTRLIDIGGSMEQNVVKFKCKKAGRERMAGWLGGGLGGHGGGG
jgi:hypothetical protein